MRREQSVGQLASQALETKLDGEDVDSRVSQKIEDIFLSPGDFTRSVFMYEALGVKSPELKKYFSFLVTP